jgi:hypothetical protein
LSIKVVKVSCRSIGCPEKIKAIILNIIHAQSVAAGSIRHQLPKPARAFGRERRGVSSTLDKDHRGQIIGNTVASQYGIDGGTQQVQAYRRSALADVRGLWWLIILSRKAVSWCLAYASFDSLDRGGLSRGSDEPIRSSIQRFVDSGEWLANAYIVPLGK